MPAVSNTRSGDLAERRGGGSSHRRRHGGVLQPVATRRETELIRAMTTKPRSFRETSGFVGGLYRFDSSGNEPIQRKVGRSVSPHPDPLPQGEGTARIAQWKASGFGLFSAPKWVHPLPKGEGWGEGKERTARRGADVLAMAYGRCPQHSMDLSH